MKTFDLTICNCHVLLTIKNEDEFVVNWRPLNNTKNSDELQRMKNAIYSYLTAEGFLPDFSQKSS